MEQEKLRLFYISDFAEIAGLIWDEKRRYDEAILRLKRQVFNSLEALELLRNDEVLSHSDILELYAILYFEFSDLLKERELAKAIPYEVPVGSDFKKLMKKHYKGLPFKCVGCGAVAYAIPDERKTSREKISGESSRGLCEGCLEEQNLDLAKLKPGNIAIRYLRIIPYKAYLQTFHWIQTRNKALERAGFKCQLCNSDDNLQVHHRTYENLGDEQNADLIVLCANCHKKFHDIVESNEGE